MTSDTTRSEITQTAHKLAEDIQEHLDTAYRLAADIREHLIESSQPDDPPETTASIMAGVDACERLRKLLSPYVEGPPARETLSVATAVEQLDQLTGMDYEADHNKADAILLAVLDGLAPDVSDAYRRLVSRSSNWPAA